MILARASFKHCLNEKAWGFFSKKREKGAKKYEDTICPQLPRITHQFLAKAKITSTKWVRLALLLHALYEPVNNYSR